ncbi:NAD-dependent epimerase/dehydratase family protein [Cronobacter muytjensii]|uniref:NAD-dependent epimerase/dehydratase family protein n=1 Tax=Cronobacter TaxID=413496 RepID=UPI000284018B|nr:MULTISPECIES: NAD-dependent epimerase/dehydratase family protein [Cronobacter]ELY4520695.1 NAD-dependent epimerase/dehydratase family protein [Cronobacter muytjensii]ELY4664928.1 NAD-dependent epimerase/dehydratase family protein [Cronobacter muytjensii]MDI6456173.1 NAD-dependent epimerase/dehydratase family protein [Cronobacter muytjensii]NCI15272.1 NAD-dependent epimerase/dehydratase family protein [Cronobacter muytjensii]NUW58489.1 NAD-dependent epimerase/dehydratase family protein [Cron
MKEKVIFIGASGFVGTRLIERALSDFDITNFDKQNSHFYPDITVAGDVRDKASLEKQLSECSTVVLLAAEHRDDVSPTSLYYDVNVEGTRNVLEAMDKHNIKNIIFTSSVAVYGLNKKNPDENHPVDPFNHYGKSKWQAEEVLREWFNRAPESRSLTIVRPTVIFGERNRGNVYNLLKQIASGRFAMVGAGNNYKSMAYVGNIVEFITWKLKNVAPGYQVYNYVDKPDLNMNQLVAEVEKSLDKKIPSVHLPYPIGMLGGYCFDILSKVTGKKYAVSAVRVKKFCATTQFDATKVHQSGFVAPFTLSEGLDRTLQYEFVAVKHDDITFVSE